MRVKSAQTCVLKTGGSLHATCMLTFIARDMGFPLKPWSDLFTPCGGEAGIQEFMESAAKVSIGLSEDAPFLGPFTKDYAKCASKGSEFLMPSG
ncbi:hypothetical protein HPB50_014505 [Hyalomma asiaticum]|uniref:Uncharacterized protein n=1 Tax=Hyalomma asiaticum TaxID=266040 RepID=A0ACB7SHG7_HYAAI|nr:hypothetical protein HPB50_014505 [Hyalomma asiaticum]